MRTPKRRQLTRPQLRALPSAGLTVTRYGAGGERATVEQLAAEAPSRREILR
jgi:hypothetical protein